MRPISAWVLVHRRSGQVVEAGGISYNKEDIEPKAMYKDEYEVHEVIITTPIQPPKS